MVSWGSESQCSSTACGTRPRRNSERDGLTQHVLASSSRIQRRTGERGDLRAAVPASTWRRRLAMTETSRARGGGGQCVREPAGGRRRRPCCAARLKEEAVRVYNPNRHPFIRQS
jgi:hypothetical protein